MRPEISTRLLGLGALCAIGASAGCSNSGPFNNGRRAALGALCASPRQDAWLADPALCLVEFASNVAGSNPRGMAFAPNGDLFVVSSGRVVVLYDANGDGISDSSERAVFGSIAGLSHGIAFSPDRQFLYVSSDTTVYRWPYTAGQRTASVAPSMVVSGMSGGGHITRTLLFDSAGRLYVSIGSATNLDTDPTLRATRSQIRRFVVPSPLPPNGVDFTSGELVASGMRNEVGMTFDSHGRMWGVENGRDQLFDNRFGGDIHYDNPSEKLNRVDEPGLTYFGYPQCWPEGDLPGGSGLGTLHADQEVPPGLLQSDAWCQNAGNVRPPAAVMPAHWAPLGITEYTGDLLPAAYRGDLFITSHGSWNREIGQVGRLIARAHLLADGTVASIEPIVGERGSNGLLRQGQWLIRPVDIQQGPDGALYFSDDLGGSVFRIAAQAGGADGGQDAGDGGTPPVSSGPPASAKTGCSSAPGSVGVGAVLALALIVVARLRRSKT